MQVDAVCKSLGWDATQLTGISFFPTIHTVVNIHMG